MQTELPNPRQQAGQEKQVEQRADNLGSGQSVRAGKYPSSRLGNLKVSPVKNIVSMCADVMNVFLLHC